VILYSIYDILQVLNAWLNTNPNYQEIQRWYSGWRSLLPTSIINHTVIKEKLTEGLMMIDRRISGTSMNVPLSTPPIVSQPAVNVNFEVVDKMHLHMCSCSPCCFSSVKAIYNRGIATSSSTVISSFKDLVEKKASEHNLLFLPITNRTFEGKQVYRFGNANIYIDKNVLFLYENGQWMPLRLNDLVGKAH
jgi:tuftelin-interacting protein 11